jgi:hypothetical protein
MKISFKKRDWPFSGDQNRKCIALCITLNQGFLCQLFGMLIFVSIVWNAWFFFMHGKNYFIFIFSDNMNTRREKGSLTSRSWKMKPKQLTQKSAFQTIGYNDTKNYVTQFHLKKKMGRRFHYDWLIITIKVSAQIILL